MNGKTENLTEGVKHRVQEGRMLVKFSSLPTFGENKI